MRAIGRPHRRRRPLRGSLRPRSWAGGAAIAVLAALISGCAAGARDVPAPAPAPAPAPIVPMDLPDAFRPDTARAVTIGDLRTLTSGIAPEYRDAILARPGLFVALAADIVDDAFDLTLVDKGHPLPEDFTPPDLVDLARYTDRLVLNRDGLSLSSMVLPDLLAMVEAARLEDITLDISSSYRSYSYQDQLFAYWTDQLGPEQAARVSARPGHSQHQLGTTVDFGSVTRAFGDTRAGRWIAANGWRYGFSLSYPEGREDLTGYAFEPWHFRHLGRSATRLEREFFGGVQQSFLEFWRNAAPRLETLLAPVGAGA